MRKAPDTTPSPTGAPPAALAAVPPPDGVLASLGAVRRQSERRLDEQRLRLALFAALSGEPEPEELAAALLDLAVGAAGAAGGVFYVARPDRRLDRAATAGPSEGLGLPARLRPDLPLPRAAGLGALPFRRGERTEGLLVLDHGPGARPAAAVPAALVEAAATVAVALEAARIRVRARRLLAATRRQATALARKHRELRAKNAELARADRYRSEFLATMSHELRTPLNSMLIMSQVLAENRGGRLGPDEVEAARTINRAGGDLLLLVNEILDSARVEAGRLDLQPERVDPRRVAADLDRLFRPTARRRRLDLRTEVAPDAPAVLTTDPLRLNHVLRNLLDNAFKFTAAGGVSLTVRRPAPSELPADPAPGPWAAFAVADTGCGMDAATAGRVCEPFFQGRPGGDPAAGGTGLGLSICARLAELLGGRLSLASAPGRGSVFVLALPAGRDPEPAPQPAVPPGAAPRGPVVDPAGPWRGRLAGRRVLLADDDMRTVYRLCQLLDTMGAQVQVARTAAAAVAAAAERPGPDLLLLAAGLFARTPDALAAVTTGPAAGRPRAWLGAAPGGLAGPELDDHWEPERLAAALAATFAPPPEGRP